MKNLVNCTLLMLLATLIVSIDNAHAGYVSSVDWRVPGDGLLTQDLNTNLQWLDITQTTGLTYNEVVSGLAVGGVFEGFAIASLEQVGTLLFSSIGLDAYLRLGLKKETDPEAFILFCETMKLFGYAYAGKDLGFSAMLAVNEGALVHPYSQLYVYKEVAYWDSIAWWTTGDARAEHLGVWLARPSQQIVPVPEPSTIRLAGIGIGVFILLRILSSRKKWHANI